jgi:hypothetical protein
VWPPLWPPRAAAGEVGGADRGAAAVAQGVAAAAALENRSRRGGTGPCCVISLPPVHVADKHAISLTGSRSWSNLSDCWM